MPETVLALDPGEKIGWARAVLYEDGSWSEVRHGITPLKDMAIAVAERAHEYDTIVYESYRIRPDKARQHIGSDLQAVQFIGMVRLSVWMFSEHPACATRLVSQGASVQSTGAKVAPPEIKEILARMPKVHDDAHDGSALCHLAYYWFQNYVPTDGRKEDAKVTA